MIDEPREDRLDDAKPLYFLPDDDLAGEVLIPAFANATSAMCMAGFFSSASLADIAPGLATYIANAPSSFRLIISPFLSEADQAALREGLRKPEELASELLALGSIGADDLRCHTLRCLSFLLARERIEIRIALMKDALFHPKTWVFQLDAGRVAAHGSSNMTRSGIRRNYEQVAIAKAWAEPTQRYVVEKLTDRFERLWKNDDQRCVVLPLPDAIRRNILQDFPAGRAPTEDEFRRLFRLASDDGDPRDSDGGTLPVPTRPVFRIPPTLAYNTGPFAHQGRAVDAWVSAGFRGILAMATGSGKTLTSMICAFRLYELHKPLLVVVAAPYIPLVDQWCGEIELFGARPVNLTKLGGPSQRGEELQRLRRRLHQGQTDVEVVVVSHDTLCSSAFADSIKRFECARLLIADEVHNLGRPQFVGNPPEFFEHRLGLSATPIRQYDPDGTAGLISFFGPTVFEFSLREAIGVCLVEYDYFLHPVSLTPDEMDRWADLTARIRKNSWRKAQNGSPDDYLAKLYRDRRLILETASRKVDLFAELLGIEDATTWRHTLVYTTDKDPAQLDQINELLRRRGLLFHQLTAEETADRELTRNILTSFQRGDLQVLTAKRVLDEGVNIPQICTAYILASTTVERQWVQRRGRLLRRCDEIAKDHSVIHDFLALPPDIDAGLDDDARSLVKSELGRAQKFASLARNAGRPDGPLSLIHRLVTAAFS